MSISEENKALFARTKSLDSEDASPIHATSGPGRTIALEVINNAPEDAGVSITGHAEFIDMSGAKVPAYSLLPVQAHEKLTFSTPDPQRRIIRANIALAITRAETLETKNVALTAHFSPFVREPQTKSWKLQPGDQPGLGDSVEFSDMDILMLQDEALNQLADRIRRVRRAINNSEPDDDNFYDYFDDDHFIENWGDFDQ